MCGRYLLYLYAIGNIAFCGCKKPESVYTSICLVSISYLAERVTSLSPIDLLLICLLIHAFCHQSNHRTLSEMCRENASGYANSFVAGSLSPQREAYVGLWSMEISPLDSQHTSSHEDK